MMPKRIQRKRTKGWRMPENAVYVGRPTKWGNPFTGPNAIEMYKNMITKLANWRQYAKHGYSASWFDYRKGKFVTLYPEDLLELRGKDLVCWCPLDKPCHADVLLEIANK